MHTLYLSMGMEYVLQCKRVTRSHEAFPAFKAESRSCATRSDNPGLKNLCNAGSRQVKIYHPKEKGLMRILLNLIQYFYLWKISHHFSLHKCIG